MSRLDDWKREARDAKLGEGWSQYGPNRIVKVVGINRPLASTLQGYITLERCLFGLTPYQIQRALGLQLGDLKGGCRIYRFKRPPLLGEYSAELTAEFPNGLAIDPAALKEERAQRRLSPAERARWGLSPNRPPGPMYRKGNPSVPQWNLLVPLQVEIPPYTLLTGVPYPHRR